MHTKQEKDLRQAAQLFSVLSEDRPGDIRSAWEEIQLQGRGWVKRVKEGVSALKRVDSEIAEKIASQMVNKPRNCVV